MKLRGSIDIAAPVEAVWALVTDPLPLATCVPGLVGMERLDATSFRGAITVSLGPIDGTYAFTSSIGQLRSLEGFVATVEGTDSLTRSRVEIVIDVRLTPLDGAGTRLEYVAAVATMGRIAILGEMVLRAAAGALVGQVTRCLRARLEAAPSSS